jgi:glc operon protein GlcG
VFEDQAAHGRPSALALARGVPLQGGIPIMADGQVVGAIGVSGASSAPEDSELAEIGAAAAERFAAGAARPEVFYAPADQVAARFATGGLLLDTAPYKVDAGRREAPGEAEFHTRVTDIVYVVEGTATVVTGGTLIGSREVGPGDYRAQSIMGGTARTLSKGDVLVIPAGLPHQYTEVSRPFLYYVVKVEQ